MGRLGRIISGISSGLRDLARKAEQNIGNFEAVFGRINGPEQGMAGSSKIMQRLRQTGAPRGLNDKVAIGRSRRNTRGKQRRKRRKPRRVRRRRRKRGK